MAVTDSGWVRLSGSAWTVRGERVSPVARDRGVFVGMVALEDDARIPVRSTAMPRDAPRCSPAWKATASMR